MTLGLKVHNFLKSISLCFRNIFSRSKENVTSKSDTAEQEMLRDTDEVCDEESFLNLYKEKINASKRTILTKFYILRQEIEVFKESFPNEYNAFSERIQSLEEAYNSNLQKSNEMLTFEIDPEINSETIVELDRIEKSVKKFINGELKFYILSKKLQKLALKLNITYNVSIFHSKQEDKNKIMLRVDESIDLERTLIDDMQASDYILEDQRRKERIIMLIAYVEYENFKISLRNSNKNPIDIIRNLPMSTQMEGFKYEEVFNTLIQNELFNLQELVNLIEDSKYRDDFEKRRINLIQIITYSSYEKKILTDYAFWKDVLSLENNILQTLRLDKVDENKIKIKIIDKMDIGISEDEVLTSPKTNACISMIDIFSKTQDYRVFLMIKLLENLSDKTTYREIYFLFLLFEMIPVIKNTGNGFIRYIEKYIEKYTDYTNQNIKKRKEGVINSSVEKQYFNVFNINGDEEIIIRTLKKLNIDFDVSNGFVRINSYYFNGLDNVVCSLKNN